MTRSPLTGLKSRQAVTLQDPVDLEFRHPHSHKHLKITRHQVPIMPAFAMTAHKAQGQTLERAIVDLENCRGTEPPYIMISRVKSLNGLLILRDYNYGRISSRQSEDYRKEDKRLSVLRLLMLKKYGDDKERLHAERELNLISKYVEPSSLVILDGSKAASGSHADVNEVMAAIDMVYAP